ncbi:MAG: hypothetical protein H7Y38_20285 [Armatimonadetes bacterium]|nr:hypothetical protein [Armatimonadota bacterium]
MKQNLIIWAGLAAAFVGGFALAQGGKTVSVDGRRASSDVLEQNGKIYVSLPDMAAALGRTVVRSGDDYDLQASRQEKTGVIVAPKRAGKNGLTGAVGETLNSSQASLTVLKVVRGKSYVSAITGQTFDTKPDTELIAVMCRFENGLKKTRRYDLGKFKPGKTALILADGKELAPGDWDRKDAIATVPALGTVDFTVLFYLPTGAEAGEFVYQVRPNDFDSTMREDVFRVQLKKVEPSGSPDAQ